MLMVLVSPTLSVMGLAGVDERVYVSGPPPPDFVIVTAIVVRARLVVPSNTSIVMVPVPSALALMFLVVFGVVPSVICTFVPRSLIHSNAYGVRFSTTTPFFFNDTFADFVSPTVKERVVGLATRVYVSVVVSPTTICLLLPCPH